jgi:hypothetical protein
MDQAIETMCVLFSDLKSKSVLFFPFHLGMHDTSALPSATNRSHTKQF